MKRRTMITATAMFGVASGIGGRSEVCAAESLTPFDAGTRLQLEDAPAALIKRAATLGSEYQAEHRGCARCTVAALQDALPFLTDDSDVYRAACCLDGNATPTKVANCGAFTGAGMILGWCAGTPRFEDNSLCHELIHAVHERFVAEYGSVLCTRVRTAANAECPRVVGETCRWTTEIILDRFT